MKKTLLFLLFLVCIQMPIEPANIIFDMNGVLVTQSLYKAFWNIGPRKFFGLFNPLTVENKLFDCLNQIKPREPKTPQAYHKNKYLLPQIVCDWLSGSVSSHTILSLVNKKLDEMRSLTDSKRKLALIRAIALFMFKPDKLAKAIIPINAGMSLLKQCHDFRLSNGDRVHKIFIISNWDYESFQQVLKKRSIKKHLALVDDIVISGKVGLIKPDQALYELAFEQFGIDPDKELTIYIDDEECNIKAAQSLKKKKLHCILCKDHKKLKRELKKLGVLPSRKSRTF